MIAALVVAAGRTARKVGFAPQKKVGTISAIERAVTVLQRADISRICVVCADSRTEKLIARRNLVFLRSSGEAQMFDCIKQGLGYLRDRCDAALIVPVDLALCSVQTVRALAAARGSVCVPAYQGRNGHPILLRGDCFDALCAYTGPDGLGGAIYHAGLDRTVVPVDDAGILADVQHMPEARRLPGTPGAAEAVPGGRDHLVQGAAVFRAADAAAAATDPGDRLFAGGMPPGRYFLQQGARDDRGGGGPIGRRAFGAATGRRQRRQLCCNGARRTADAALPGLLRRRPGQRSGIVWRLFLRGNITHEKSPWTMKSFAFVHGDYFICSPPDHRGPGLGVGPG